MLVNNGYAMVAANLMSGTSATCYITRTDSKRQKYYGGAVSIYTLMGSVSKGAQNGVIFTDGTTPATLEDICFSGTQFTTLTESNEVTLSDTGDGVECTGVYTLTNTDTVAHTISEICLYTNAYTTPSASSGYFMIDRTILAEPVTIPAKGVAVITYTIRMNYPTE